MRVIELGIALGLVGLIGFDLWSHQPDDGIKFLQVGQGDATLISDRGTHVLIDCGPESEFLDAGERLVWPVLHAQGIRRLDAVVISHFDRDHYGGLESLARRVSIDRLVLVRTNVEEEEIAFYRDIGFDDSQIELVLEPEIYQIGRVQMDLYPGIGGGDDNAISPFIAIAMGARWFGISGDAPVANEELWIRQGVPRVDVLKAGHHGSDDATGQRWLAYHQAEDVIISCGRNNIWGHPDQLVQERIERSGAQMHRTDRDGSIWYAPGQGGRRLPFRTKQLSPFEKFFHR